MNETSGGSFISGDECRGGHDLSSSVLLIYDSSSTSYALWVKIKVWNVKLKEQSD